MDKLHNNPRYKRFECKLYKKSFNSRIYNKKNKTFCPFCGYLHKAIGDLHKQTRYNPNTKPIIKFCRICRVKIGKNNVSLLCRDCYLENYWGNNEKNKNNDSLCHKSRLNEGTYGLESGSRTGNLVYNNLKKGVKY